jgi:hypothetical protein
MKKTRSSFRYSISSYKDILFVYIVDLDYRGMEVTTDIDNVIEEICEKHSIKREDRCDYLWIYCDSDGVWDGYDPLVYKFIDLAQVDMIKALLKYNHIRVLEMQELLVNK